MCWPITTHPLVFFKYYWLECSICQFNHFINRNIPSAPLPQIQEQRDHLPSPHLGCSRRVNTKQLLAILPLVLLSYCCLVAHYGNLIRIRNSADWNVTYAVKFMWIHFIIWLEHLVSETQNLALLFRYQYTFSDLHNLKTAAPSFLYHKAAFSANHKHLHGRHYDFLVSTGPSLYCVIYKC